MALARASAPKPGLIRLGEPLSALDAKVRLHLRLELKNIQVQLGVTSIMVIHSSARSPWCRSCPVAARWDLSVYLFGNQGLLRDLVFGGTIFGAPGIVVGSAFFTFPHALLIISTALAISNARLYEAVHALRASPMRTFLKVRLPGARYGLTSAAFVVFTLTISEFGVPKVVGGDYNVLAVDICRQVVDQQNFAMGAVVSEILLIPAVFAFAVDRYVTSRQVALLSSRAVPHQPKRNPRVIGTAFVFVGAYLVESGRGFGWARSGLHSLAMMPMIEMTEMGRECQLLGAAEFRECHGAMLTDGPLEGGLWSPHEPRVESRRAIGDTLTMIAFGGALSNSLTEILADGKVIVGAVVIEVVFVYPGIGQLMIDAVASRDVPVVQACSLIFASVYIVLNLLADVLAILANPRQAHRR